MAATTSAMEVTKKTVMRKTSRATFRRRPPPRVKVKAKVRPMRPRKRPLLAAAARGRKNGTTVRYESPREMTRVRASASRFTVRLGPSSGPRPAWNQSWPRARATSPGLGRIGEGELHQTASATPTWTAMMRRKAPAERARLGAKAARSELVRTRGADYDLHAPVLGPPFRRGVGGHRILLPMGENADAAGREIDRRLLLQPVLDRERPLFGEGHVALGGSLAVGVAVDLDRRSPRYQQVPEELVQLAPGRGRESRLPGVEGDLPGAAAHHPPHALPPRQ